MANDSNTDDADEFAGIEPARRRKSPVAAGAVIALAGVLCWHLRADIRYAFGGRTPHDLGDVRTLAARGEALADNAYVTLRGQPDRRNALFIEPRGDKVRQAFHRLLGTGSRVLVRAADTTGRADLEDRWTGRLRRFDALGWAPAMREYFKREVEAQRWLTQETLKAALGKGEANVTDRTGAQLTLRGDTPLAIDVSDDGRIEVLLPRDKVAAPADALHEVERLGLTVQAGYGTEDAFGVVVDAPAAGRNAVLARLEDKGFEFQVHEVRYLTRLDKLSAAGSGLQIAQAEVVRGGGGKVPARALPVSVPWAQVKAASVAEPVVLAPDAYVLTEDEAPGGYYWAPVLVLVLLGFAAFNVWYLLRARDPRSRHPST